MRTIKFTNHQYVAFGFLSSDNGTQGNLWLHFFDDNGNNLRDIIFYKAGTRFQKPYSITALSSNKIILGAGWGDYQTPWLLAIDSLGRVQREWLAPTGLGLEYAYGLQPTPDGGVIFCGARFDSIFSPDHAVHMTKGAITKLNSNLQLEWTKIVGESTADNKFVNGIITQDGNYVAIGQYVDYYNADGSQGAQSAWTQKVDMQGNGIWSSKDTALYIPSRNATLDYAWDIKELSSGSLIICGNATDLAAQPNRSTAFLIKLSSDGGIDTLFCHGQLVGTEQVGAHSSEVRVYPNPASDILNIEIPQNGVSLQYKIYDVLGRELQIASTSPSKGGVIQTINVSILANGIYYLSIYENNRLLGSSKFVVQHE